MVYLVLRPVLFRTVFKVSLSFMGERETSHIAPTIQFGFIDTGVDMTGSTRQSICSRRGQDFDEARSGRGVIRRVQWFACVKISL